MFVYEEMAYRYLATARSSRYREQVRESVYKEREAEGYYPDEDEVETEIRYKRVKSESDVTCEDEGGLVHDYDKYERCVCVREKYE